MPRSGTTLIDKLLSLHPQALVFSQPLPLLYVRVKAAFLSTLGDRPAAERRYPLTDLFRSHWVAPEDFREFLDNFLLDESFCRATLEEMAPFDGQYTKPEDPFQALEGYRSTSLNGFVGHYLNSLADDAKHRVLGSKETTCEEYIPYFLAQGARVVEIVRDPRDVISSLDYGRGHRFGGRRKPLLFNLRQWRKSISFALAHQDDPGFLAIRYEDLACNPGLTMARITDFLGLDRLPQDALEGDLKTQSGELWRSNSSHRATTRVTSDSVGRYRQHLPREVDVFVQTVCFSEMKRLGYEVEIDQNEILPILDRYQEHDLLERPELGFYAWSEQRRDEEKTRWRMLEEGAFEPEWFVFKAAFSQLLRWQEGQCTV